MQNFDSKIISIEKTLENIRGIFDKNKVENKLKEIEVKLLKDNFWKDKKNAKKNN